MRWLARFVLVVCGAGLGAQMAGSEVVYDGVVNGSATFTDPTYNCSDPPNQLCTVCYGTNNAAGPGMTFGREDYNGQWSNGQIAGSISLSVQLDGLWVEPSLLPGGSYFQNILFARHMFCNPCCFGSYVVGDATGSLSDGEEAAIVVPATIAGGASFSFDFCNYIMCWGTACGFVGSGAYRWKYHAAAPVRAASFAAGDLAPFSFGGTGLTLDFLSSPGGTVTASNVAGAPTDATPIARAVPQYWEARTNMAVDSFNCALSIAYDPLQIDPGIPETDLAIAAFDPDTQGWTVMNTTVDEVGHTATASGLARLSVFVLVDRRRADVPERGLSAEMRLSVPRPNPSRAGFACALSLPRAGHVRIDLYDTQGRLVAPVIDEFLAEGSHEIRWTPDGETSRLACGIYYLRARSASSMVTRSVLIVR